jgi:hypothetical protein
MVLNFVEPKRVMVASTMETARIVIIPAKSKPSLYTFMIPNEQVTVPPAVSEMTGNIISRSISNGFNDCITFLSGSFAQATRVIEIMVIRIRLYKLVTNAQVKIYPIIVQHFQRASHE